MLRLNLFRDRRWLGLLVLCLGQFMILLDSSIVNVALPTIQGDLHFGQASLTWVVNAYLISYGAFQLTGGRLGDLIGRRRVFLAGVAVFTVASVLCGLAQDQTVLVAARFLQGLGGSVAAAVIIAILISEFVDPVERAQAMSIYMFVIVAGGSLGLLAGGVLTQLLNWHWIFFVNLPIGIVTVLLGRALIRENPGIGLDRGVDIAGSVLVTVAIALLVYAVVTAPSAGWTSLRTFGLGLAAAFLLGLFAFFEARLKNPIMPLYILRLRSLINASIVRAFLATGMFSTFFFGALDLGRIQHFGAIAVGLAFLPVTLGVGTMSLGITARVMGRIGARRTLLSGLLLVTIALVLLARASGTGAYFPLIFSALLLLGVGAGNSFMPVLTLAMAEVPRRDSGLASGVANVTMQISRRAWPCSTRRNRHHSFPQPRLGG